MADVLILAAVLLFFGWHLRPREMRNDLWKMIRKEDSPYD
jgi:hypothetical protein